MISWGNGIFGRDSASSPDSACACSGEVPHAACADGATCCPHPTSSSCGFRELNQCKSPGAAGRAAAELSRLSNLWQRGGFGGVCTKRCPFISKASCVSRRSLPRGRDCPHPYGSCQHHPSPCQKEHRALNFPLDINPPLSSFLRPPPKTAAIAHTCSSKAGSGLFKSTAGILIIHIKRALLANDSLKLSWPARGAEEPCQAASHGPASGQSSGLQNSHDQALSPRTEVARGHSGEEHPGRSHAQLLAHPTHHQPPALGSPLQHLARSRPRVSTECFAVAASCCAPCW